MAGVIVSRKSLFIPTKFMDDITDILSGFGVDFNNPETLFDYSEPSENSISESNDLEIIDGFGGDFLNPENLFEEQQTIPEIVLQRIQGTHEIKPKEGETQKTLTLLTTPKSLIKLEKPSPKLFCPLPKNDEILTDRTNCLDLYEVIESENERIEKWKEQCTVAIEKSRKEPKKPNLDPHIRLVIDTEFFTRLLQEWKQSKRIGLTSQIRGIHESCESVIFAHQETATEINQGRALAGLKPYPVVKSVFHPIDYINHCYPELNAIIRPGSKDVCRKLPKLIITIDSFFAIAELNMICSGWFKEKLKELQRSTGNERIEMGRRARCVTEIDGQSFDWVDIEAIVNIAGNDHALRLRIIDTCAVHGVAGYKAFCEAVAILNEFKDNFTAEEKSRMLDMVKSRALDFEQYGLGDLSPYDALEAYAKLMMIVYERLKLSSFYQEPKLTIGGTVKDIFLAALADFIGVETVDENGKPADWRKELKEIVGRFIQPVSANDLRQESRLTKALLAKVEGGRCRNNRPTDVFVLRKRNGVYDSALICDIDISGCYGEGQRNQDYFMGIPEFWYYKANAKNNQYVTLRQWLKSYNVPIDELVKGNLSDWGELINGSWYARIGSKEPLKYPQDYFASWFHTDKGHGVDILAKFISQMKSDTELQTTEHVDLDEEQGNLKIFNHEIHNAVLTHDGLEWILFVASPRQRNEILDKVRVLASAVYPASTRLGVLKGTSVQKKKQAKEYLEQLKEQYDSWEHVNTTERKIVDGRAEIVMTFRECTSWFSINQGDLLVTNLLVERKLAQQITGKKSPLDTLFKLDVNTLYGDMVSKFFVISNVVTGNNITARARALAWYMEKGLMGFQSITDGCGFEPNHVPYPIVDRIDGEFVNQHRTGSKLDRRKVKLAPLGGVDEILMDDSGELFIREGEKLTSIGKGSDNAWINQKAMEHLQNLFPHVSVLHGKSSGIKIQQDFVFTESDDGKITLEASVVYESGVENVGYVADKGVAMKSFKDYLKEKGVDTSKGISGKVVLTPTFKKRSGQFNFETKNVYHSGSFHGSANYAFFLDCIVVRGYGVSLDRNKKRVEEFTESLKKAGLKWQGIVFEESTCKEWSYERVESYPVVLKARGYETGKEHWSFDPVAEGDEVTFTRSDRYNSGNNPAKDLLCQLVQNPNAVIRQTPAIKKSILKLGDYKNLAGKFDQMGIEPGDNLMKVILMQEFSLTQFTFLTHEQYSTWKNAIEGMKQKDKQSIESFFLNPDGTLRFLDMVLAVDKMINDGVMNPLDVLDPRDHRKRASKRTVEGKTAKGASKKASNIQVTHPHLESWEKIRESLGGSGGLENL